MKKTPPTLADMCVTSALDKRVWGRDPGGGTKQMVDRLLKVPRARKFVLDGPMSEFMADLHDGILSGGLRKRNVALENARQMSRSPHPLTWIEFEFPKFFDRLRFVKKYTMVGLENADQEQPAKLGWLIEQHPTNPAAFRRTEVWAGTLSGAAMMHPISLAWCSDDSPLPYPRWPLDEETSEAAVAGGYRSTQASLISTFSPDISESMLKEILRGRTLENSQYVIRNATTLQTTWALLATINDLPVTYEGIRRARQLPEIPEALHCAPNGAGDALPQAREQRGGDVAPTCPSGSPAPPQRLASPALASVPTRIRREPDL